MGSVSVSPLLTGALDEILDDAFASETANPAVVALGDELEVENLETLLRGHGTRGRGDKVHATVSGVVERVNQLVTVKTLRSRYVAQVGDVVVARVRELGGTRWRAEAGARQDAYLPLSAVSLPGDAQRRRGQEDELGMRAVFREGDLLSAEVHSIHADGGVALSARGARYGRLPRGQLVNVPAGLVRRVRRHARAVEAPLSAEDRAGTAAAAGPRAPPPAAPGRDETPGAGPETVTLDLVLGVNGWLWVGPHRETPFAPQDATPGADPGPFAKRERAEGEPGELDEVPLEARKAAARIAQAARALATLRAPIHSDTLVLAARFAAVERPTPTTAMLDRAFLAALAARLAAVRVREAEEGLREREEPAGVVL